MFDFEDIDQESNYILSQLEELMEEALRAPFTSLEERVDFFHRIEALQEEIESYNTAANNYFRSLKLTSLPVFASMPEIKESVAALLTLLEQEEWMEADAGTLQERLMRLYRTWEIDHHEADLGRCEAACAAPILKPDRRAILREFTSPAGGLQAGRISNKGEEPSPYRPFHHERERQILRQAATQLHFALAARPGFQTGSGGLIETQMMHLTFDSQHCLVVALNEHSAMPALPYNSQEAFHAALKTAHPITRDREGKVRTQRYARKLTTRLADPTLGTAANSDETAAYHVAKVLETGSLETLELRYKLNATGELTLQDEEDVYAHLSSNNTIFFIKIVECPARFATRHAEEFLADLKDLIATRYPDLRSCIGGKKRPCLSCFGRMEVSDITHGAAPGRIWVTPFMLQPRTVADRTIEVLSTHHSHVSLGRPNRRNRITRTPDYDSGSDSEGEGSSHTFGKMATTVAKRPLPGGVSPSR